MKWRKYGEFSPGILRWMEDKTGRDLPWGWADSFLNGTLALALPGWCVWSGAQRPACDSRRRWVDWDKAAARRLHWGRARGGSGIGVQWGPVKKVTSFCRRKPYPASPSLRCQSTKGDNWKAQTSTSFYPHTRSSPSTALRTKRARLAIPAWPPRPERIAPHGGMDPHPQGLGVPYLDQHKEPEQRQQAAAPARSSGQVPHRGASRDPGGTAAAAGSRGSQWPVLADSLRPQAPGRLPAAACRLAGPPALPDGSLSSSEPESGENVPGAGVA